MIWYIHNCPNCGKKRHTAIYAKETYKFTRCECGLKYKVIKPLAGEQEATGRG